MPVRMPADLLMLWKRQERLGSDCDQREVPYFLYADQVGIPVGRYRAIAGVGWLRTVTDLSAIASDPWRGKSDLRSYWMFLKRTRVESVLCLEDPLQSLAEVLMLPYLFTKVPCEVVREV